MGVGGPLDSSGALGRNPAHSLRECGCVPKGPMASDPALG